MRKYALMVLAALGGWLYVGWERGWRPEFRFLPERPRLVLWAVAGLMVLAILLWLRSRYVDWRMERMYRKAQRDQERRRPSTGAMPPGYGQPMVMPPGWVPPQAPPSKPKPTTRDEGKYRTLDGLDRAQQKTVTTWMRQVADALGRTLVAEGVSNVIQTVVQGPMIVSFYVWLPEPTKNAVTTAKSLGPALEQSTGQAPIRVAPIAGSIVYEIPSPYPVTPKAWDLTEHVQGTAIPVGLGVRGQPLLVNLRTSVLTLFVGPTRSGKTMAIKSFLYNVLSSTGGRVRVLFFAFKTEDWLPLLDTHGVVALYNRPEVMDDVLRGLADHMEALAARGDRSKPPTVVVLDDLPNLLARNGKIADEISRLAAVGGAVGFYLLIGSHSSGSKATTGGQAVDMNIGARVVYRPTSSTMASMATGGSTEGTELLTGKAGDALLMVGAERHRVATPWITSGEWNLPRSREAPVNPVITIGGRRVGLSKQEREQEELERREREAAAAVRETLRKRGMEPSGAGQGNGSGPLTPPSVERAERVPEGESPGSEPVPGSVPTVPDGSNGSEDGTTVPPQGLPARNFVSPLADQADPPPAEEQNRPLTDYPYEVVSGQLPPLPDLSDARRPLTPSEADIVSIHVEHGLSRSQACVLVYGSKGRNYRYIQEALA